MKFGVANGPNCSQAQLGPCIGLFWDEPWIELDNFFTLLLLLFFFVASWLVDQVIYWSFIILSLFKSAFTLDLFFVSFCFSSRNHNSNLVGIHSFFFQVSYAILLLEGKTKLLFPFYVAIYYARSAKSDDCGIKFWKLNFSWQHYIGLRNFRAYFVSAFLPQV